MPQPPLSPSDAAQIIELLQNSDAQRLAEQQLMTAWIQAGAAVAQAVGAIAAIIISVRLANQAARREIAAEHAATARAEAAEAAAIKRAEEVERRAEERELQQAQAARAQAEAEEADAHNGPINLVLALVDETITATRAQSDVFRQKSDASLYGYRLWLSETGKASTAIEAALHRTHDVALTIALNRIQDVLRAGKENPGFKIAADVANDFDRFALAIEQRRADLAACLR